jgi:hypothetical protein
MEHGRTTLLDARRARTSVLKVCDEEGWRSVLPWTRRVTASLEYARIREEHVGYTARLFVFESNGARIVKPFFLRSTLDLSFSRGDERENWDILSPEYTGPIVFGDLDHGTGDEFRRRFSEFCREEHIIAEFAHLHPFDVAPSLLEPEGIAPDREIVWVDLTLSEDRLWRESFAHACRKNVKRAQREGVRVFRASEEGDIREFHRIYAETMRRNRAEENYLFPLQYFMDFFERMPESAVFFLAEYRDRIVAATLYLHDDSDVYSYLGGADPEFQHVRPTNAVIFALIRFARERGMKRFILGGGYRPDDGILRFKSTFSPLRARFQVYRHVYMSDAYERLSTAWSEQYGARPQTVGYFPVYRASPEPAMR